MRLFWPVAAVLCLTATSSFAGGRAACDTAAGYVLRQDANGRAVCVLNRSPTTTTDVRGLLVGQARDGRRGFFCRYPHRPSDTIFVGGAGYLIKDDVRRAQGCL